jgi:hypothetical protein
MQLNSEDLGPATSLSRPFNFIYPLAFQVRHFSVALILKVDGPEELEVLLYAR